MNRSKLHVPIVLVLLVVSLFLPQHLAAQEAPPQLIVDVLEVDSSDFPSINVRVRTEDGMGVAVEELAASDYSISEAHENPSVTPAESPVNLAVVIDLSATTHEELHLIQSAAEQLMDGIIQSGDALTFVIIKNKRFVIRDGQDPASVIDSLTSTAGFVGQQYFNLALDAAIDQLMPVVTAGENTQVILIGNYLPSGHLTYSGTAHRVPLHVVQAHISRSDSTSSFSALATGEFVEFRRANSTSLQPVIDAVNRNRRTYLLSYRSRSGESGLRNVELSVSANGSTASDTFEYTADLTAPRVEIISSESDFRVQRNAVIPEQAGTAVTSADGAVGYTFDKGTEKLTVAVNYSGYSNVREVQLAELYVDDNLVQKIEPEGTRFELQWDVSEYKEGGTHPAVLRVHVVDYFGIDAYSADYNAEVFVNIPEQVSEVVVDPCVQNGQRLNTFSCIVAENTTVFAGVAGTLAVAVVGLGVFVYVQRGQIAKLRREGSSVVGAAAAAARQSMVEIGKTVVEAGSRIRKTIVERRGKNAAGIDMVWATLTIVSAPNEIMSGQKNYELKDEEFSIGREMDAGVNLALKHETVSARHCTLRFDSQTGQCFLRDEHSANGTFVDAVEVPHGEEILLPETAEIQLATRSAIKLKFAAKPQPASSTGPRHSVGYPGFSPDRAGTIVETNRAETPVGETVAADEYGFSRNSDTPRRTAKGQRNVYGDIFSDVTPEEDDTWLE